MLQHLPDLEQFHPALQDKQTSVTDLQHKVFPILLNIFNEQPHSINQAVNLEARCQLLQAPTKTPLLSTPIIYRRTSRKAT